MWLKLLPYLAIVSLFGWGTIEHQRAERYKADVQTEIGKCNTASVQTALDAEVIAHEATRLNYELLVADLASQAERERESREIAEAAARAAKQGSAARDETITRMMLEASIDDIPDSKECLNVFAPESSVDRLRVRATDCDEIGFSTGPGADQACASAERIDAGDPASGDFSNVTYGDTLKLWGKDRDTIEILNGRLRAISALSGEGLDE